MADFGRGDPEVLAGKSVFFFSAPTEVAELWVRCVAIESGQRVDWGFFCGRAAVSFLGDERRVRDAITKLRPALAETMRLLNKDRYGIDHAEGGGFVEEA